MIAVSDFSGLMSSAWALAKAEASAATDSLDRGMGDLRLQHVKAYCPRFRSLCFHAVPNGLPGILRHQGLELAFGPFVVEKGAAGVAKERGELGPRIGRAHIDDSDGLDARPRRLGIDEMGRFAGLHAAPEFLFRRHQHAEIERVHGDRDLHPLAAPRDDREHRGSQVGDPHIVLDLGHVLFGCGLLRERPRQHEFGLEYCPGPLHDAVEGRHHPRDCRMLHAALDVSDVVARVALVPRPVELLGSPPELYDEVTREVLGLGLASLLPPKPDQGGLVAAHDDPSVRAADEALPIPINSRTSHLGASYLIYLLKI